LRPCENLCFIQSPSVDEENMTNKEELKLLTLGIEMKLAKQEVEAAKKALAERQDKVAKLEQELAALAQNMGKTA
jgi:uncharacterized coiled-coil protein SlyX